MSITYCLSLEDYKNHFKWTTAENTEFVFLTIDIIEDNEEKNEFSIIWQNEYIEEEKGIIENISYNSPMVLKSIYWSELIIED